MPIRLAMDAAAGAQELLIVIPAVMPIRLAMDVVAQAARTAMAAGMPTRVGAVVVVVGPVTRMPTVAAWLIRADAAAGRGGHAGQASRMPIRVRRGIPPVTDAELIARDK
jgi:hypothetical protein